ncbi:MAG: hypothetical protein HQL05_02975 [Nitrospirae bacterium]|uniref:hypothetical protein n=1 Tax=Candidatus Magnetobacterium casense TaxID=1455061 RepID=UPI000695DDEF|nr:hypothetical protein [Candidatus Magnetobacterium casensis]MBF0336771.1 hypothetical protein [Nitrospirota bacterium]
MTGLKVLSTAVLLCLIGVPAMALMVAMETADLTRGADVVVCGRVSAVKAQWSEDGKRIVTRSTVSVGEYVKGAGTSVVTVEQLGGEVDGVGLRVSDTVYLKAGDEVILFLKQRQETRSSGYDVELGVYTIVGSAQGIYVIDGSGKAVKGGFSLADAPQGVDFSIEVGELIRKIRSVRD